MNNIDEARQLIDTYLTSNTTVSGYGLSRRLKDRDLLAPDDLSEEWTATVRFTNEAGQWETHTGMGGTEQEALDDARTKQRHLYQPREDAYRTAWRWISKWHMNDQVTHLDIVEGQPDED